MLDDERTSRVPGGGDKGASGLISLGGDIQSNCGQCSEVSRERQLSE
jgi:hypothetical protein